MKITIEPTCERKEGEIKNAKVSIEIQDDDLDFCDVLEDLIKPALIAWGFHPKTVEEELGLE